MAQIQKLSESLQEIIEQLADKEQTSDVRSYLRRESMVVPKRPSVGKPCEEVKE